MRDGLKDVSDKEVIKAKIEDFIKEARIEKAFDLLEENAECFNASKEDIHLARANYVKAEKDNELGLSDREELGRVQSRTIRFIQRIIGKKRTLGIIGSSKFWVIAVSLFLIMSSLYIGIEYTSVDGKDKVENTTLSEDKLKEYFRKLKDPTVEITEKNELIEIILYQHEGVNFTVEIRGSHDNLIDSQSLSYFLKQLKLGIYDEYIVKHVNHDTNTIIIKRIN